MAAQKSCKLDSKVLDFRGYLADAEMVLKRGTYMYRLRLLALVSCIFLFMPNLSSGECTALPKKNDLYIPLACTFDDIVGTWSPTSRLIM